MQEYDDTMMSNEVEAPETIIDIDTSDAREPIAVDDGEYRLRITGMRKDKETGAIVRVSEKGNRFFILTFDIPAEEFSKGLSKMFMLPSDDMEPKRRNAVNWELDCFKRAFGLQVIDFNNIVGKEGDALLVKVGSENAQYGIQNEIKKFIVPA